MTLDWAALWARFEKSNLLPDEAKVVGTSRLLLLVSEGLSSLLVGLLGGEWVLATVEKADFSFDEANSEAKWWAALRWGNWAAAKRLLYCGRIIAAA